MRYKFIIILLLLVFLGFTVWQMLRYEQSIREERVVREYLYDESGAVFEKMAGEELRDRAERADYYFRANGDYFDRLNTLLPEGQTAWEPIFFKGVNLGVALPGKFPAEFSMSFEQYYDWLKLIGEMNANVIRTYTILPPEFYEAFSRYNLQHHDKPLYLMQGVWAKVPADKDYFNEAYKRELQKEIVDVIDVLHGNAVIDATPGKASGVYSRDISKYVAAIIFGREWEPDAVHHTNLEYDINRYRGDFVSVNRGNPMECWLAQMLDFIALYETQTYGMQHPLSFVNWLPLDPMYHHTEIIENEKVREYDNDLECVDFTNLHRSRTFYPGVFASWHVYPYYPDYIYLDSAYRVTSAKAGESDHFLAYMEDLKAHHKGMPLIVSEYGVPSSRGNSHVTPAGYDQGGHSEEKQAAINLKLTRDIVKSGCAGAIIFEWADEWFKHNWLVMEFESPAHHRPRWHNLENPEQNFGLLALESRTKTMDGDLSDWDQSTFRGEELKYASAADPGYFYLALELEKFDFRRNKLYIALDVIGGEKGDHRLPFTDREFERGFEFLLEFSDTAEARILVDEPYSVFTDIYNDSIPSYASRRNANGRFVPQLLLTNRGRESLSGQKFDSVIINRSPLVHGRSDRAPNSNADWYWNEEKGILELRLTWHLLNVTDPSQRYVLNDRPETPEMDYEEVDAFRALFFITDAEGELLSGFPASGYATFSWDQWEMPEYSSRLKPAYDSLKAYFSGLEVPGDYRSAGYDGPASFSLEPLYGGATRALSVSMDGGSYSQFVIAAPLLRKYHMNATYGLIPGFLNESPGLYENDEAGRLRRMSVQEVRELREAGNQFAFQAGSDSVLAAQLVILERALDKDVPVFHKRLARAEPPDAELFEFTRYLEPGMSGRFRFDGVEYRSFSASGSGPDNWHEELQQNDVKWSIAVFKHFYTDKEQGMGGKFPGIYISENEFDRRLRLARNEGYWIGTEIEVYKYLKQVAVSELEINRFGNTIFLKIVNELDKQLFNQAMTVKLQCPAGYVEIAGSETDGLYHNRHGSIYFEVVPGREVSLQLIEE